MATSNVQFAERVGCHFSTASRYRHGQRLPSHAMLKRIAVAYDLDVKELALACALGPERFGALLRRRVFNTNAKAA